MSSAGTVTGKGFVISYSVSANLASGSRARGGYAVTIDTVVANADQYSSSSSNASYSNATSSDTHKFFNEKIALAFTTGSNSALNVSATGSGSMKYILGS